MNWHKVSDYCIRSDCGYKICKVMVKGEAMFELWEGRVRVGDWASADEAKAEVQNRDRANAVGRAREG